MRHVTPLLLSLVAALGLASATRSDPRKGNDKPDLQMGIFARNCTACHDLALVEEAHKTKTNAEMREILRSHKDKEGFEVTEGDWKTLQGLY